MLWNQHYAIKDGHAKSLQTIKLMYMHGDATKDDYNKSLQARQAYLDEIKSDQRDEAVADDDCKYYKLWVCFAASY